MPAPEDLLALQALLPVTAITRSIELADTLVRTGSIGIDELAELASIIEEIATSVSALAALTPETLADFGNELGDAELWTDVAAVLAEYLFLRLIEHEVPVLASIPATVRRGALGGARPRVAPRPVAPRVGSGADAVQRPARCTSAVTGMGSDVPAGASAGVAA